MLRMGRGGRSRGLRPVVMLAGILLAHGASAGGYDTGERDWDFLFQQSRIAAEAGVRYIDPQRTLKNVANTWMPGTTASVREAAPFAVSRASVTVGNEQRCMASYRQPWGGHADYGSSWAGAASAITQDFSSSDYGVTCALGFAAGPGRLSAVGGLSWQRIEYRLTQAGLMVPGTVAVTDVRDEEIGWRAGVAYEIPQYALRASLIYNSAIKYHLAGTYAVLPTPSVFPIFGAITMPQSIELKAQSGVAPGWLAFGAIKWTNWGVVNNTPLCVTGVPGCMQVSGLTLAWRDTWTVTLGAAHPFSETFAIAPAFTWDQGASQGFTSQTDTWTASLTGVITPNKNTEIKLGATAGILTAGAVNTSFLPNGAVNPVGYTATFGDDFVYALNASAKIQF